MSRKIQAMCGVVAVLVGYVASTVDRPPTNREVTRETAGVTGAIKASRASAGAIDQAAGVPDGNEITQIYLDAKTVDHIKLANQKVELALSGMRILEARASQTYEGMMGSCGNAGRADLAIVQSDAAQVRLLGRALAQVDARFSASIEAMRRTTAEDPNGILAFKTKAELRRFENAYNDFSRLRVSVNDVAQALTLMAQEMPKARAICQPTMIPSLAAADATKSSEPPKAPRKNAPVAGAVTDGFDRHRSH